jgi:uncharacterized protein YggT (Ycf19 family)
VQFVDVPQDLSFSAVQLIPISSFCSPLRWPRLQVFRSGVLLVLSFGDFSVHFFICVVQIAGFRAALQGLHPARFCWQQGSAYSLPPVK